MTEISDVTMLPCERPGDDTLAALLVPHRPFPEGNGWYAHFFYSAAGEPAYKRLTHGDHADIWYRVAASD
jgi:hypothetical protein